MITLGIDLGTSEIKLLLLNKQHQIVATTGVPLTVQRPQPLWSEQQPADWWAALDTGMARLRAEPPLQFGPHRAGPQREGLAVDAEGGRRLALARVLVRAVGGFEQRVHTEHEGDFFGSRVGGLPGTVTDERVYVRNVGGAVERQVAEPDLVEILEALPHFAQHQVLGCRDLDTGGLDGQGAAAELIANQAGMAIENSMLYNRVEDAHSSLRDAKERLVHGERLAAIGEMAANLAHELKNPLITIGGFAGRLLKGLPTESRESHYAETIVKEVGRLEKMLAEILAFSRKPTICYQSCNIASILKDCIENCQATLEDQSILCSVTSEDDLSVLGDGHQLKQAFLNLMLNACDAMPSGGRIGVVASRSALDKHSVRVIIRDSGGGIPAEMLPKIFNPFFTTKRHGTGLGLAIVNRIVTNHGGRIEAGNHGEGAEFTIILPMEKRHT